MNTENLHQYYWLEFFQWKTAVKSGSDQWNTPPSLSLIGFHWFLYCKKSQRITNNNNVCWNNLRYSRLQTIQFFRYQYRRLKMRMHRVCDETVSFIGCWLYVRANIIGPDLRSTFPFSYNFNFTAGLVQPIRV